MSNNPQETIDLARKIAKHLKKGSIICLHGELGSGKTTFVKGLAQALGIQKEVQSPTFVLMNIYEGKMKLYHVDLYRLEDIKEIERIGYEEFLFGDGLAVVEWADKLKELYPSECLTVTLHHAGEEKREVCIKAKGKKYEGTIKELSTR